MRCPSASRASASVALALALTVSYAAPFVGDHSPHDHWAQLLHADRFEFVARPTWHTLGDSGPEATFSAADDGEHLDMPSLARVLRANMTTQHASYTRLDSAEDEVRLGAAADGELEHVATRSEIFKGEGGRSRFEIHGVNVPANLQIKSVMKKCLEIMEEAWVSPVPVLMKVSFTDLGGPDTLARGGGTYFVMMPDLFKTALPVAAAEAIRKRDLNSGEKGDLRYDVLITMNTRSPWYDGTSGSLPNTHYDLCTVLLHEIYHNLVFAGAVQGEAKKVADARNGILQRAWLYKGYRTRYDSFLANKNLCSVLGYLTEAQLASQQKVTTEVLFAHSCANVELYFAYQETRVARLYAPNIFKDKSSVYHLDYDSGSENSLMFATVKKGASQHVVSPTILKIQAATLNTNLQGANTNCARPLAVPFIVTSGGGSHPAPVPPSGGGVVIVDKETPHSEEGAIAREFREDGGALIGGLPIWAFVLILLFAVLLALLLCGLCLALLLRRRKKREYVASKYSSSKSAGIGGGRFSRTSSRSGSRTGTGTGTGTSRSGRKTSKSGTYIAGVGGRISGRSRSETRRTSTRRSSAKQSTFRPFTKSITKSITKSSTKRSKTRSADVDIVAPVPVCPSSGKSRVYCMCKCCCKDVITRPAPVASVHTFDPDSVPNTRRPSSGKHCKKVCKKVVKSCHHGCHCGHCCRYKPVSARAPSKCTKTVCKTVTTKCATYKCDSSAAPSSKKCTRCSGSSSKSHSRVPSAKPPTFKPRTVKPKPPSTKPPPTRVAAASSRCCRASGKRCGCGSCKNIVEINVGYNC